METDTSTPFEKTKKSSRELLEEEIIRNPHKYGIKKSNPKKTVAKSLSHNFENDLELDSENTTQMVAAADPITSKPDISSESLLVNIDRKECEEPQPQPRFVNNDRKQCEQPQPQPRFAVQEQVTVDSTDPISSTSVKKPLDLLTKIKNFTAIKEAANSRNNEKLTMKSPKEKSLEKKKKKKCRRKKEKRRERKYSESPTRRSQSVSPTSVSEYSQDSHKIPRSQSRNSFRYSDSENTGSVLEMDKSVDEILATSVPINTELITEPSKKDGNPLFSDALSSIYNVCIERLQDFDSSLDTNPKSVELNLEPDKNESNLIRNENQELRENVQAPNEDLDSVKEQTKNEVFVLEEKKTPNDDVIVSNEELQENEVLTQHQALAQNEELTQNEEIDISQNQTLANCQARDQPHLENVKIENIENKSTDTLEPCTSNENVVVSSETFKDDDKLNDAPEPCSTETDQVNDATKAETFFAEEQMEVDNLVKETYNSATNPLEDKIEANSNELDIKPEVIGEPKVIVEQEVIGESSYDLPKNQNETTPDNVPSTEASTQENVTNPLVQESCEPIDVKTISEQDDDVTKSFDGELDNAKLISNTASLSVELKKSNVPEIDNAAEKRNSSKKSSKKEKHKADREKSKKDGGHSSKHSDGHKTKDKIDKTNRNRSRSRGNLLIFMSLNLTINNEMILACNEFPFWDAMTKRLNFISPRSQIL